MLSSSNFAVDHPHNDDAADSLADGARFQQGSQEAPNSWWDEEEMPAKTDRNERAAVAAQTVAILDSGCYKTRVEPVAKEGGAADFQASSQEEVEVDVTAALSFSVAETVYLPEGVEIAPPPKLDRGNRKREDKPPSKSQSAELSTAAASASVPTPATTAAAASADKTECVYEVCNEGVLTGTVRLARLAAASGGSVAVLNFASASNPGGGFIKGSQAQEESLARSTGLYACLLPQKDYYAANRGHGKSGKKGGGMLKRGQYTHGIIYSPKVPFFRSESGVLSPAPFTAAVVTAPAVNMKLLCGGQRGGGSQQQKKGTMKKGSKWEHGGGGRQGGGAAAAEAAGGDEDGGGGTIATSRSQLAVATMRERIGRILDVCMAYGHTHLVLGAFGCGVFGNDPAIVADLFMDKLEAGRHAGRFQHVSFSILDPRGSGPTFYAFKRRVHRLRDRQRDYDDGDVGEGSDSDDEVAAA